MINGLPTGWLTAMWALMCQPHRHMYEHNCIWCWHNMLNHNYLSGRDWPEDKVPTFSSGIFIVPYQKEPTRTCLDVYSTMWQTRGEFIKSDSVSKVQAWTWWVETSRLYRQLLCYVTELSLLKLLFCVAGRNNVESQSSIFISLSLMKH